MPIVTLRNAGSADSEFAFQTRKAALGPYVERVWGWNEAEQRVQHERRFAAHGLAIVQWSGEDVGVLALVRTPDYWQLNQLFLRPEHQGQGIGARCMERLIEETRRAAVPLRLKVLTVNARARAFYERLGFERVGETLTHVLMEKCP